MDTLEGFPVCTITYGRSGKAKDRNHTEVLRSFVANAQLDELLVLSHGWNNSASEAKGLYRGVLKHLKDNLPKEPALAARKIGVLAIVWPSKRFKAFEREDAGGHAGGAASAEPVIEDPMLDAQALVEELSEELSPEDQDKILGAARAAIEDAQHWPEFLETLRKTVPTDAEGTEEADAPLFDGIEDPDQALAQFDFIDVDSDDDLQMGGAAGGVGRGAAGAVGSVLNLTTFYTMKRRAGSVGQFGVAHTLFGLRNAHPNLRIHFAGHSFGGRVVTMTANAINGHKSAAPDSMTLLQAAFSHNSFSASFPPPNKPGFFRAVMANKCVKGPILVTHTFNDIPVRVAYSVASALSGENASAIGDSTPGQFGGLGANGAQHMKSEATDGQLLPVGAAGYAFRPGHIFNLKSDNFIKSHSDVRVPEVGYALVRAMAATL